jgi:hypothetical protein
MQTKAVWGALVVLVACDAGMSSSPGTDAASGGADSAQSTSTITWDATSPPQNAMNGDAMNGDASSADATSGDAAVIEEPAPREAAAAPEASIGNPPPMACDMDAAPEASANDCPPPLSTCADGKHLAFYDWGQCVGGTCVWPAMVMTCPFSGSCWNGACQGAPTQ